ncbi:MAG: hypothetical protein EXR62_13115 [Chloroflexi bacterium]|nr:hypothetical protein [Chloroflexota bacterium]
MRAESTQPKIGLVLGGGGSRGIAHIGVLEILVQQEIPIDLIVGTSMGGIIGVLFALGTSPQELAYHLKAFEKTSLFNVKLLSARARQHMLRDLLAERLEGKSFHDLKIPVILMAVDMLRGQEVALTDGALMPAVLATSAVPAVFPPVRWRGMQLADGGVIDSLATHVAYQHGADKVIAVDLYPPLETDYPWTDPLSAIMGVQLPFGILANTEADKAPNMVSSIWRAVRVMAWHIHEGRLAANPPDVLLRPAVEAYGSLDFTDTEGPIRAGSAAAERHLAQMKALFESEE